MTRATRFALAVASALVGLAAAAAAPATGPPTFTANNTADLPDANLSDGLCLTASGDCTLRAAIQQADASGGANIRLLDGATYTLTRAGTPGFDPATGDLNITTTVTIQPIGSGRATVQGGTGWNGSIFEDELPAVVTLTRLDIANGHNPGGGGAIANDVGGTMTVNDCTITGSSAAGGGGGIFNDSHLTVKDSTISGNSTPSAGGGILSVVNASVLVSTISGNSAAEGGGVYADAFSTMHLEATTVSGNSATDAGGGVFAQGTTSMAGVTVSGNSAGTDGGGAFVESGSTASLSAVASTIANNNAARSGGGIHVLGTASLVSDTIAGNTADADANGSGDGGGIANVSGGSVSMRDSILANGHDATPGGGLPDCAGSISSGGYNLIESTSGCSVTGSTAGNITGMDPRLGPLQDNGGFELTEALLLGRFVTKTNYFPPSPAIDAGDPTTLNCSSSGQNPVVRPADGNGDGIARCDIGAYELPAGANSLGTWSLDPTAASVRGDRPLRYTLSWTVPPPGGWRHLDTLNLILRDDAGTALWLRFREVTGTDGLFSVVDAGTGVAGPEYAPGSRVRLDGGDAVVDLAKTSVDGPPGATVTLHLTLQMQHSASGRALEVLVGAIDDSGATQGPHPAGTLTVG